MKVDGEMGINNALTKIVGDKIHIVIVVIIEGHSYLTAYNCRHLEL